MASQVREEFAYCLRLILKPLIKLLLRVGLSYRDFSQLSKELFVEVATAEYGVRGRPTSFSRVALLTGLSRREVRRLRARTDPIALGLEPRLWSGNLNPATEILHYWHTDPLYSEAGKPQPLPFSGKEPSFSGLVKKYSRDIPAGAVRTELLRSGALMELRSGELMATRAFHMPLSVDLGFIRSMAFSLSNLIETVLYNSGLDETAGDDEGRLERYVWSSRVTASDVAEFRVLAGNEASSLLLKLDQWLGEREQQNLSNRSAESNNLETNRGCGLGIYYFERG